VAKGHLDAGDALQGLSGPFLIRRDPQQRR